MLLNFQWNSNVNKIKRKIVQILKKVFIVQCMCLSKDTEINLSDEAFILRQSNKNDLWELLYMMLIK